MKFILGLEREGLQEDEGAGDYITDIRTIEAPDLISAKQKWAEKEGVASSEFWDNERKTFWHQDIVEVNEKDLPQKE